MSFVCRMRLAIHDPPGIVQCRPYHIPRDISVHPGQVNSRGPRQEHSEQLGTANDHELGGITRGAHSLIDAMHHVTPSRR